MLSLSARQESSLCCCSAFVLLPVPPCHCSLPSTSRTRIFFRERLERIERDTFRRTRDDSHRPETHAGQMSAASGGRDDAVASRYRVLPGRRRMPRIVSRLHRAPLCSPEGDRVPRRPAGPGAEFRKPLRPAPRRDPVDDFSLSLSLSREKTRAFILMRFEYSNGPGNSLLSPGPLDTFSINIPCRSARGSSPGQWRRGTGFSEARERS